MQKFLRERFSYILLRLDTIALPLLLGFISLLWGIILLDPSDTFGSASTYSIMRGLASENTWGVFMLLYGFTHIVAALFNFRWQVQAGLNLGSAFKWITISISLFYANPATVISAAYPVLALLAYIRFFRCVNDRENL